ncbi:hypothetical protein B7R21_15165 [Subtercola boreus]|uniref:Bacterial Pleckstrin homology domain-containing protein n=1 Tax=Subtercola boreus TaxID=120213 RepID=A0A3E0VDI1_9MICO|nr:hypothetical protein [Subtercola boreus]RFA07528.1 hypothetical protein B7R21_15165 [Subtercola boreus]
MTPRRRGTVDTVITDTVLAITPRGRWKFFSLRRRLEIPHAAVISARVVPDPTLVVPVRIRVGGTGTLTLRAGYMRGRTGRSWWCYRYGQPAVVVTVDLPRLTDLVIITDDNAATVDALSARRGNAVSSAEQA